MNAEGLAAVLRQKIKERIQDAEIARTVADSEDDLTEYSYLSGLVSAYEYLLSDLELIMGKEPHDS